MHKLPLMKTASPQAKSDPLKALLLISELRSPSARISMLTMTSLQSAEATTITSASTTVKAPSQPHTTPKAADILKFSQTFAAFSFIQVTSLTAQTQAKTA
jgi:hypothetical protein